MASAEVLDFAKLLAPISESAPAGMNLRRSDGTIDPDYDKIKTAAQDARTKERLLQQSKLARDSESKKDEKPEPPNWRKVEQEANRVLAEKSKDLWVAAWFIEALVRTSGFAGARDGFRLVRELVENYWEILHPTPSPDDDEHPIEFKLSQLAGLNGSEYEGVLIAPLRGMPLLVSDEFGSLSLWDYNVAEKIAAITDPDARQKRLETLQGPKFEDFENVIRSTPLSTLQRVLEDIRQTRDEFDKMNAVLEARCVDEQGVSHAPPVSSIRGVLEECQECVLTFLRKIGGDEGDSTDGQLSTDLAAGGQAGTGVQAVGSVSGRVQTRDEAFRALLQVADYFRRTEPHSPVSYALEQAVRWGRLALPDLLKELIADGAVRSDVFRRAGIPEAPEG